MKGIRMSGIITLVNDMRLSGTEYGKISVGTIEEPYGEGSESVASIAISLQGKLDDPDWKVHIPYANIEAVIEALQEAKARL